jgi:predicted metal-dependent peptidase
VIYNPQFVLECTADEVKAVAIHEIMHVALLHPLRLNGRNPEKANIAMDYAINLLIKDCGYQLPQGALINEQFRGMSWEQIYNLIPDPPDNPRRGTGNQDGPYSKGDVIAPDLSKEDASKLEEEIKVNVAQSEQTAKAAGCMPGPLQKQIADAREPEEDYRYLFDKFMAPIFPKDYTWQRPSRRFMAQDMYLPSIMKDGVGKLVVGLDTSGSVSKNVLNQFLGLINHFLVRVKPEATHVLYCDHDVYKHEVFKVGSEMDLSDFKVQRGGTRFSPVFAYAQENSIKPKAYVYLTDMECLDFGPDPGVPVIWLQVGEYRATPPFGTVIKIKEIK